MSWWYHLRGGQCKPLPGGPYIPRVFEDPTCGGDGSVSLSWDDIIGKPSCFDPCEHEHVWDEILEKPLCFEPCDHTHLWEDITDKPECFPPCEHTHPGLGQRERGLLDGGTVYNAVPHRIIAPPPDESADIGVTALDGGEP